MCKTCKELRKDGTFIGPSEAAMMLERPMASVYNLAYTKRLGEPAKPVCGHFSFKREIVEKLAEERNNSPVGNLQQCGYKTIAEASVMLGITTTHVRNLITKLRIKPTEVKRPLGRSIAMLSEEHLGKMVEDREATKKHKAEIAERRGNYHPQWERKAWNPTPHVQEITPTITEFLMKVYANLDLEPEERVHLTDLIRNGKVKWEDVVYEEDEAKVRAMLKIPNNV